MKMKKAIPTILRALSILFVLLFVGAVGGSELENISIWVSIVLAIVFLALAVVSARGASIAEDKLTYRQETSCEDREKAA
jgi:succinate-acetate transporter protein